jgi:1-acyl-sn-glycerol-3-phosphate acyltransferase
VAEVKRSERAAAAAAEPERISRTYRFAMRLCGPVIRRWGRLEASGIDLLPRSGPLLVVGNHDSYWDPVAIGVAGYPRRQIRALAKDTLWNIKPLAPILDGMGQVPIKRGAGDVAALEQAIEHLRAGECIGVFVEGTSSRGRTLRARSGVGRLAQAVPEARIVCVAVTGTVAIARFPERPRVGVEFFEPAGGQMRPGEEPGELARRLLAELRAKAPIVISGRKRRVAKRRRALAEAEAEAAAGSNGAREPG